MPSYVTPKKNTAYVFTLLGLTDQSDTNKVKANPSLSPGDVIVYVDGVLLGNITTLPTVIGVTPHLTVSLTAAEMNGDNILVAFIDVAGAQWCDLGVSIQTTERQIDDLFGAAVSTTIATLASQTSFTLTAGSADNDAYNGLILVCEDGTTAVQKCVGIVSDYTGSTKTVTLLVSPGIFTMAVGDKIKIFPVDQRLRYIGATAAGEASGAGSGTETFVDMDGTTNRLVATVDASGNRTAITYQ